MLVTILTPTKDRCQLLRECIESVLAQDYQQIEHVIVDGASTDGTVDMLTEYAESHPGRVRFLSEPDKNCGEALNKGLKMARGDVLGWLGSDDMLGDSDAANSVVSVFSDNPQVGFLHGHCDFINMAGRSLYLRRAEPFTFEYLLNTRNPVVFPSAYYRRSLVDQIGPWDEYGNDYEFLLRLVKNTQVYALDKILSRFRMHDESETGDLENMLTVSKLDYDASRRHGGRMLSSYGRLYFGLHIMKTFGLLPLYKQYSGYNYKKHQAIT